MKWEFGRTPWWRLAGLGLLVTYLVNLACEIIAQRSFRAFGEPLLLLGAAIVSAVVVPSVEGRLRRSDSVWRAVGLCVLLVPLPFLGVVWLEWTLGHAIIHFREVIELWCNVALFVACYGMARIYLNRREVAAS